MRLTLNLRSQTVKVNNTTYPWRRVSLATGGRRRRLPVCPCLLHPLHPRPPLLRRQAYVGWQHDIASEEREEEGGPTAWGRPDIHGSDSWRRQPELTRLDSEGSCSKRPSSAPRQQLLLIISWASKLSSLCSSFVHTKANRSRQTLGVAEKTNTSWNSFNMEVWRPNQRSSSDQTWKMNQICSVLNIIRRLHQTRRLLWGLLWCTTHKSSSNIRIHPWTPFVFRFYFLIQIHLNRSWMCSF